MSINEFIVLEYLSHRIVEESHDESMIVWKVLETLENKKVNNLKSPNGTNIIFNHLMRELGMKNYFELPRILKQHSLEFLVLISIQNQIA